MPRINMSGQEGQHRATWQDVQSLIMENLFDPKPKEENRIRQELRNLIEEFKQNVCETDRRTDD